MDDARRRDACSGAGVLSRPGAEPPSLVIVELEPELVGDLVRQHLAERGVTAVRAAEAEQRAAVAVASESLPAGAEAEVVVRLPESGQHLPAVVDLERAGSGGSEAVVVSTVDELIDLLVGLVGREANQ
jgi:hypothetical protein